MSEHPRPFQKPHCDWGTSLTLGQVLKLVFQDVCHYFSNNISSSWLITLPLSQQLIHTLFWRILAGFSTHPSLGSLWLLLVLYLIVHNSAKCCHTCSGLCMTLSSSVGSYWLLLFRTSVKCRLYHNGSLSAANMQGMSLHPWSYHFSQASGPCICMLHV